MKTFNEFIEDKKVNTLIERAANLMVEMDIEPNQLVLDFISKNPELEADLVQEGFMDTLGRIKDAAVQFGKNVWDGSGIRGGATMAKDIMMGPVAKFNSAVKVLNDLKLSLEKNDQLKNLKANDGTQLTQWFQKVIDYINKQKDMVPRMVAQANTQPQAQQPAAVPTP